MPECRKCKVSFRPSTKKEGICAKCEVEHCQVPENPEEVAAAFSKFVEETYGEGASEMGAGVMNCSDILNHRKRLMKLLEVEKDSNKRKNTKENNRKGRDIQRLIGEHDAVQQKIAKMQSDVMNILLLQPSSASINMNKPSTTTNNVFKSQEFAKSPAQKQVHLSPKTTPKSLPSTPTRKEEGKEKPEVTPLNQLIQVNGAREQEQQQPRSKVMEQPPPSDLSPDDDDEELGLKRSDSVKDRIKAFESLTRRESKGKYDEDWRSAGARRKLKFT